MFKVSAICTNTCETATPLAYCCDCDRVVHLSPFSSTFFINNNTTSQLRHHKVRAALVWWLNLIIDLAIVSIIHVQNSKYQNKKHLKNVGPIHHCEPPHAACSDFILPFTRCRYCRMPWQSKIDVHNDENNDNAWQRGPLWPHRIGPITI